MVDLQEFLKTGEIGMRRQNGKNVLFASFRLDDDNYRKGVYFKDLEQLNSYLRPDSDFLREGLKGIEMLKAEKV